MERNIKKLFLDKGNQIYIEDNCGILYLYENEIFYPFIAAYNNIKQCFSIDNKFYIYHSNTINVFNDKLSELNEFGNAWITKRIDQVCYDEELDIIVTLENGKIFINMNISDRPYYEDNDIKRTCLPCINKKYVYVDIKLVNNLLLTYGDNKMNVYYLNPNAFTLINTVVISNNIFCDIRGFNSIYNMFELANGSHLKLSGEYISHNNQIDLINRAIFVEYGIYFTIRDDYLLCFHDKKSAQYIYNFFDQTLLTEVNSIDYGEFQMITYFIPTNCLVLVTDGVSSQVIIVDKKPYMISDHKPEIFTEIKFTDEAFQFEYLNSHHNKTDIKLVIDIDINVPTIDQLINIVPQTYRLNSEMIYCFEQVDSAGNIISYGEGVTRHIFNTARKEIDNLLKNNLSTLSQSYCFNLGKLIYFCNKDSGETFFHIHPYFFYLLTTKCVGLLDCVSLMRNFKGSDFDHLYRQYLKYYADPSELAQLGMGIETVDQYVEFLFSSDLTDQQILLYKSLVDGYCVFAHRKYHQLVKKMPIINSIQQLVNCGYFNVELEFISGADTKPTDFVDFCKYFKKIFADLTMKEKSYFSQNVTSSQYFLGTVNIIYDYVRSDIVTEIVTDIVTEIVTEIVTDIGTNNQLTQPIVADTVVTEPIVADTVVTEPIIPVNNPDAIIFDPSSKIEYMISTCNTEIIVNLAPTMDNVANLIKMLIVEDINMKN